MSKMIKMPLRLTALILFASLCSRAVAQGTVVTGIITDNRNVPIVGARACQVNSANCAVADMNGVFHLLLEPGRANSLNVTCPGFNPADVNIGETTALPLRISLVPMYIPDGVFANDVQDNPGAAVIVRSALSFDLIFTDFSEFAGLLGTHNTEAMDYFSVTGPEIGASFPRFFAGFGIGMGYSYEDDEDTLIIDLNNTAYKLSLGYDIISTDRIRMTPLLSVRWLKYRLQNYPGERSISLENYLEERETDLRFHQTIAVAGLNIEYLMHSGQKVKGDYWSVGLYGGYAVKLNQKPWIRSEGNRITTDSVISLRPFTAGISVAFYNLAK
jgi:hypothetical protein